MSPTTYRPAQIEDLYDIVREAYRALSSETQTMTRRAILSVIVEDVIEALIADYEARPHAGAHPPWADLREPAPDAGLQVYGILARTSAVAANRLMKEASPEPADVVPYGAIAAIVGEVDYAKTRRSILELLAGEGHTVLPLQPGLRCRTMRGVLDMLATQYEVLQQGLTELENQAEWVISIYCDRLALLESVRASDRRVDRAVHAILSPVVTPPLYDIAFFSMSEWVDTATQLTQPSIDRVADTIVENCIHRAHRSLAQLAHDSMHHHPATETSLVSSSAYAVPRSAEEAFRASLQTVTTTYHRLGFSVHSIGPRTPTIFARPRDPSQPRP